MPKSFAEWVRWNGLQWQMTGEAHRLSHGGIWHRGGLEGWANCGKAWLGAGSISHSVGRGHQKRSPWQAEGEFKLGSLCRECFSEEWPLMVAIQVAAGRAVTIP